MLMQEFVVYVADSEKRRSSNYSSLNGSIERLLPVANASEIGQSYDESTLNGDSERTEEKSFQEVPSTVIVVTALVCARQATVHVTRPKPTYRLGRFRFRHPTSLAFIKGL